MESVHSCRRKVQLVLKPIKELMGNGTKGPEDKGIKGPERYIHRRSRTPLE